MKKVKKLVLTAITLGVVTSALTGCNVIKLAQRNCFIEYNGVLHFGYVELPTPFSGKEYKIVTKCGITEKVEHANYSRSENTNLVKNTKHKCQDCFYK